MKNLISDRFEYIRINESHASHEYLDWLSDFEVNKFLEIRHQSVDLNSLRSYLKSISISENEYLFGIFYSGKHIGNIKLGPIDKRYKRGDIGLLIGDKKWWNKGVASESIKTISDWGFRDMKLNKIEAGCYESNEFSKKSFVNVGYQIEGLIRDHFTLNGSRESSYKLGMTVSDWNEINNLI